jgi:transcriptional regulator with XRE-family HTH domain
MSDDFASALRALMDERDISQTALARRAYCDRAYVCRLANGAQRPSRRIAATLDEVLGAGGKLAALAAPPDDGGTAGPVAVIQAAPGGGLVFLYANQEDDEDPVKRRAFLLDLAVLAGIAHTDPAGALEAARHELNGAIAQERASADVSEWHAIAVEYGEAYLTTAPAELLSSLGRDFAGLRIALSRHGDDAAARELCRVAALLAAFTAQTIGNLGHAQDEWRWWRTARAAAGRSGDRECELWVRGREIVRKNDHQPRSAVLHLAGEAEALAGQALPGLVLAAKAEALALTDGRGADTRAALAALRELPAGHGGSLLAWSEENLHNAETFTWSRLGDLEETDRARCAALALYQPSANVRWPAENELHLAFCLVRSGDIAGGTSHAREIVTRLPAVHRTGPILSNARSVLDAIPEPGRRRADTQEYREWLNDLARAQ